MIRATHYTLIAAMLVLAALASTARSGNYAPGTYDPIVVPPSEAIWLIEPRTCYDAWGNALSTCYGLNAVDYWNAPAPLWQAVPAFWGGWGAGGWGGGSAVSTSGVVQISAPVTIFAPVTVVGCGCVKPAPPIVPAVSLPGAVWGLLAALGALAFAKRGEKDV